MRYFVHKYVSSFVLYLCKTSWFMWNRVNRVVLTVCETFRADGCGNIIRLVGTHTRTSLLVKSSSSHTLLLIMSSSMLSHITQILSVIFHITQHIWHTFYMIIRIREASGSLPFVMNNVDAFSSILVVYVVYFQLGPNLLRIIKKRSMYDGSKISSGQYTYIYIYIYIYNSMDEYYTWIYIYIYIYIYMN